MSVSEKFGGDARSTQVSPREDRSSCLERVWKANLFVPLSLWERVRVRASGEKTSLLRLETQVALTPGPSPKGRGETFQTGSYRQLRNEDGRDSCGGIDRTPLPPYKPA